MVVTPQHPHPCAGEIPGAVETRMPGSGRGSRGRRRARAAVTVCGLPLRRPVDLTLRQLGLVTRGVLRLISS